MEKTCANCFYNNRKMSDTPCNTCMSISNEYKENWTGIEEKSEGESNKTQ